jgi:predicted CXXCH cytochrome family protein
LKRFSLVLALAMILCLAFVGSAYANFGPHGGYANDTDSCAGCHRAHTSFSTVQWVDGTDTPTSHSALLVGSASTMTEFCNACHGDTAPGAATNVQSGVFDSGPSGASGIALGAASGTNPANGTYPADGGSVAVAYQTASQFNAPLNGGGFDRMPSPYQWETNATVAYQQTTSAHNMESVGVLWGAGNASDQTLALDCTSCHDPHGTSNYRLLKANVNGVTVGGYESDGITPNAFVFSNETGYPAAGWLKHGDGAAQMLAYRPNYTQTDDTPILHKYADGSKSLSVWCAACHTQYAQRDGSAADPDATYDYGTAEPNAAFNAGLGVVGAQTRHRHPVDVNLDNGKASNANKTLTEAVVDGRTKTDGTLGNTNWVPLEHNTNSAVGFEDNFIGCLTCHRAHGSGVAETGYAAAHLAKNASGVWGPVRDGVPGVDPAKGSSNLLRADNRGVCERCHNK